MANDALRIATTYGGGGVRTTMPREGIDIGETPDFWADLNRLQSRLRPRATASTQAEALARNPATLATGPTGLDRTLSEREKQARLKQLQAEMGPAPTKMTYIGAGPGFLTEDPYAMNAYQRQLFLPQGAGFQGPSLPEMDVESRGESADWYKAQSLEERQKRATKALQSGGSLT